MTSLLKPTLSRALLHTCRFFAPLLLVVLFSHPQAFAGARKKKSRPAPSVTQSQARPPPGENASPGGGDTLDATSQQARTPYKRPSGATTAEQRASVQGQPCVDCGKTTPRQVADHKTPLVKEHYETGQIDKQRMREVDAVQPQCPTCSAKQGADMSRYSKDQKKARGLE
jgi:hypothetical protein